MKKTIFSLLLNLSAGISSFAALTPITCTLLPLPNPDIGVPISHPRIPFSGQAETTNWAGYVSEKNLVSPECGSVSFVYGSWTVPEIAPSATDTYTSLWVGIDGFSNSTVEQIGTGHDWLNGVRFDYAWFEMYPIGAFQLDGFPLNIGDVIAGEVSYIANYTFKLTLYNYTQEVYTVVPTSYTMSPAAQRSSAEWIVEAPYLGGVLDLAQFSPVTFTNCLAVLDSIVGPINNQYWMNDALTMVNGTTLAVKAFPSALTTFGRSFTVNWASE